jgi:hypothetical protein
MTNNTATNTGDHNKRAFRRYSYPTGQPARRCTRQCGYWLVNAAAGHWREPARSVAPYSGQRMPEIANNVPD